MPRAFSTPLNQVLNSPEFTETMLLLVTLVHEAGVLRFVRSMEDVTSLGRVFMRAAFQIGFPDEGGDSPPVVSASFDAANTDIVEIFRGDRARPQVQLEIALRSSPDSIEDGPITFEVLRYQRQGPQIVVELGFEPVLNEAIPAERYTPTLFPSLFAGSLS